MHPLRHLLTFVALTLSCCLARAAEPTPDQLIGYNEQRTNLPGGRHANVSTTRAKLVRADGTGLRKLADRGGYRGVTEFLDVPDYHGGSSDVPVWSADAQSVFGIAKVGNNIELFRISLAGQPVRLTTSADGTSHYHPKPSPDGRLLIYGSKRNGVRNLYVMRLSDRQEHALTDVPTGHAAMRAYGQPLRTGW